MLTGESAGKAIETLADLQTMSKFDKKEKLRSEHQHILLYAVVTIQSTTAYSAAVAAISI